METYFPPLSSQDILSCKHNTTSDLLLIFDKVRSQPKSYSDLFIFNQFKKLQQEAVVKFLFRGMPE
jgi:hypothetical protein